MLKHKEFRLRIANMTEAVGRSWEGLQQNFFGKFYF
jgi:hypothetical protein